MQKKSLGAPCVLSAFVRQAENVKTLDALRTKNEELLGFLVKEDGSEAGEGSKPPVASECHLGFRTEGSLSFFFLFGRF